MAKSSVLKPARPTPDSADAKGPAAEPVRARKKPAPRTARGLKQLAQRLRDEGKFDDARAALRQAAELAPEDPHPWIMVGYIDMVQGDHAAAREHFERALALKPDDPDANQGMATIFYLSYQNESGLHYIDRTLAKRPDHPIALICKVQILTRLFRMEEATALCKKLIDTESDREKKATHWNDLGNIHRAMGELKEGEIAYRKAASLTDTDPAPLSNWLTLLHYMPDRSPVDILEACKEWARKFAPTVPVPRPVPADRSPDRKLRIGMFSDGFRQHPVGAMTTSALEHLAKLGFELYIYTTNGRVDEITQRVMATATRWMSIANVRDEELARRVREDGIDVLVDLAGHNSGNRIRTMTLQPAPILMKWVGGLINTTGVEAIDYLLTDNIESPPGSDSFYTEKLVRMPDDYICYVPPTDAPEVAPLPALKNGYITFGCFNNPAKVNEVVLAKWAGLLNAVPGSRLYLKGGAYGSEEMQRRILAILNTHGIDAQRVRLEGQSVHAEHMACYNEVDVALDPWPYSGGLTTCEAMMMGVPVVTLPGPTFAGRHSATHLINAGMPELVVADWAEYHARALELVADLNSLSTIRTHLRRILLESPVCDGARFARHLAAAMRAIWQRYCEGKHPAALSFTKEGQPWFEGDDTPVTLAHATAPMTETGSFDFSFQGRIITLDHGGALLEGRRLSDIAKLPVLQAIAIDPVGNIKDAKQLQQQGILQHYQANVALGDGQRATLYACLEPSLTGTLEPLPPSAQLALLRQGTTILARIPVATVRLDDINELDRIDWLALDHAHDNVLILQGAQRLLSSVLTVHVRTFFVDVYKGQPALAQIGELLAKSGLRMLRLDEAKYGNYFPVTERLNVSYGGSQLLSAEAIFIPDETRMKQLDRDGLMKLAFILHSAYGLPDAAYDVLSRIDAEISRRYLQASGLVATLHPADAGTRLRGVASNDHTAGIAEERNARHPASYPAAVHAEPALSDTATRKRGGQPRARANAQDLIRVVDIGANPIDGDPPYKKMLTAGKVSLVGFEPQESALRQLLQKKGQFETYLPYAVGSGDEVTLHLCRASGMTSTLRPNFPVLNHFQGYPVWAQILGEKKMRTVRLDDVEEVASIDWLKIDIQGGELTVFKHGENKLRDALVIQTEVNFIQLYENQPLFAEIDQWMRAHGFMLHTLLEERRRLYAPYVLNGQIHEGLNQLTTADAVYIRDINALDRLTRLQRLKMATILRDAYGSVDLAQKILAMDQVREQAVPVPGPSVPAVSGAVSKTGVKRFVHICYNNIHTQKFISMLEDGVLDKDFRHQVYIEKGRSIPGYDNDISRCPAASFFDRTTQLAAVAQSILAPDVAGVFVHGLFFDWQKQLIRQVGPHKKVTWFLWGGDLYTPIRQGAPIHDVVQHIHAIASDVDGDYRLCCETYGAKPRLRFAYPTDTNFTEVEIPAEKSKTIFVGNSGDPGNLHMEILDNLVQKQDIADYQIVMPVSYNFLPQYADALAQHIHRLGLTPRVQMLTEHMAPDQYHAMVAKAELFVTAHHRSQAYGNLIAGLYFGTKSILRKHIDVNGVRPLNPNWEFLANTMDIQPIDYDDFVQSGSLAALPRLSASALQEQQQKILKYYDKSTLTEMLRQQFKLAAKF